MLGYSLQAAARSKGAPTQSFSSLLPKALSAVLHPTLPPGLNSDPQPSRDRVKHTSPNLEQLQTELRDLRDQFDQMKSQHKYGFVMQSVFYCTRPFTLSLGVCDILIPASVMVLIRRVCCSTNLFLIIVCSSKEIKLLMNELDEEKRIRLTLQVRHEEAKGIHSV